MGVHSSLILIFGISYTEAALDRKREKKSKDKYEVKYRLRRVFNVPDVLFLYGLTLKIDQKTRRKGILASNQSI